MSDVEKRLIAEGRKIAALRERIQATTYMTASEVKRHLHMSRDTLEAIPAAVLPWVPGNASAVRVMRRYHPADVAAYPARARRWKDAVDAGRGPAELATMAAEIRARDERMVAEALDSYAA